MSVKNEEFCTKNDGFYSQWQGHSHWERFVSEAGEQIHGAPPTVSEKSTISALLWSESGLFVAQEVWAPYTAEFSQKINNLIPRSGESIETPDSLSDISLTDRDDATITPKRGGLRSKARATGAPRMTPAEAVAWHAASEGNHDLLQAALIAGADRDFQWPSDERGTLLHAACTCSSVSCTRLLLDPQSELDRCDFVAFIFSCPYLSFIVPSCPLDCGSFWLILVTMGRLSWGQLQRLALNLDVRDPQRSKWEVLPEDDSFLPIFGEQIIQHILHPIVEKDPATGIVTREYLKGRPSANHHLRDCQGRTPVQIAGLGATTF